MALKKYDDAAKTALIIARQEQDMGSYALAHSVVLIMSCHVMCCSICNLMSYLVLPCVISCRFFLI